MFKNYLDYAAHVSWLNKRKNDISNHHVIPVQAWWPNTPENIAEVLESDHKRIHQELDVAWRYFSERTRKQRLKENWHILLTAGDIEWRADIQRVYLEWVDKLPNFLQDLHEVKIWELATSENEKLFRLTWDRMEIILWGIMHNHQMYVDIQKETSRAIYLILKNNMLK